MVYSISSYTHPLWSFPVPARRSEESKHVTSVRVCSSARLVSTAWTTFRVQNANSKHSAALGSSHLVGLLGEFVEEDLGEAGHARIVVLQAQGQAGDVALHLHHVVEDQVRQHHQAVASHACNPHIWVVICDLTSILVSILRGI
jgi:hypothetical protein